MATFYKYAERSAESQVNWAEIGKDMTDMLRQEVAVREEKKAAIDEAVVAALALRKSVHDKELADITASEDKAKIERDRKASVKRAKDDKKRAKAEAKEIEAIFSFSFLEPI